MLGGNLSSQCLLLLDGVPYAHIYVALDELPFVGFGNDLAIERGSGVRHFELLMNYLYRME